MGAFRYRPNEKKQKMQSGQLRSRLLRKQPSMLVFIAFALISSMNFLLYETQPLHYRSLGSVKGDKDSSDDITIPQPTEDGSVCYYDGHCPLRSFCVPNLDDSAKGYGTCMPFGEMENTMNATLDCYNACLRELQMDEHFYHEKWPVVLSSSMASANPQRPAGCVLQYRREPEGPLTKHWQSLVDMDKKKVPPYEQSLSIQHWVKHSRFRHVKRVDPVTDDGADDRWMAFCTSPCTSNATCTAGTSGSNAFMCQNGACVRNPDYWQEESKEKMVIVTGVTKKYLFALANFYASARKWSPEHKLVVYNLGDLTPEHMDMIESWSNVLSVEWRDGIPTHYPPHVQQGSKYAWKPLIINETLHKYHSIFWLDAGSTFTGPIDPLVAITQQQGMAVFHGQDNDMKKSTSHKTFEWFGYDKDTMEAGPSVAGGIRSYVYPSRYVSSVLQRDVVCALDESCIAPKDPTCLHRFDQSSLSVVAYAPKVQLPHYTEFLAARFSQLNHRSNKPSFRFLWTTRSGYLVHALHDPETACFVKTLLSNNTTTEVIEEKESS